MTLFYHVYFLFKMLDSQKKKYIYNVTFVRDILNQIKYLDIYNSQSYFIITKLILEY